MPTRQMTTYDYLPNQLTDRGAWMIMHSGRPFYPADPRPEEVDVQDIAHSLSKLARFNGHTRDEDTIYSIAQHAVMMARWMREDGYPAEVQYAALHHDDDEYIVGDISSPVKHGLGKEVIKSISGPVKMAINTALDVQCDENCEGAVKLYDMIAYATEQGQLTSRPAWTKKKYWADTEYVQHRVGFKIPALSIRQAREEYLAEHYALRTEMGYE